MSLASMHVPAPEGAARDGGEILQGAAPVEVQVAEVEAVLNLMAANFEQRFQEMDDRINFMSGKIEQRFQQIDDRSHQVEVCVDEVRNKMWPASPELGGDAQAKKEHHDILVNLAQVVEDVDVLRRTQDRSCRDVEVLQQLLDGGGASSPKEGAEALRSELSAVREELHRTTHNLVRRCEEAEVACGQGIEGVQESTAVTTRALRNEQQGIMGQCERMVASLKESLEVSMAQHLGTAAAGTEALRREFSSVQSKGQFAAVEANLTQIRAQLADAEARDSRLREDVSALQTRCHTDALLLDEKILQMQRNFNEVHEELLQGNVSSPGPLQDKRCASLERAIESMRLELSEAKMRLQAGSPDTVFNDLRGELEAFKSQLNVLREEKALLAEALHQDVVQAQLLALREEAPAPQGQLPPGAGQGGVEMAELEQLQQQLQQEFLESSRAQQAELQRVERHVEKEVMALRTVVSSLRKEVVEIGRDLSEASPGTRSMDSKPDASKAEASNADTSKTEAKLMDLAHHVERALEQQRSLHDSVEAKVGIVEKMVERQQSLGTDVEVKLGTIERVFERQQSLEETVAARLGTAEETVATRLGTVEEAVAAKLGIVEHEVAAKLGTVEEVLRHQQSLDGNVEARLVEFGSRVERVFERQRLWEKQQEDKLETPLQPQQLVLNQPRELEPPQTQSQPQQHMQLFGTEAVVETLREEIQQLHYGQGRLANQISSLQDIKQLMDDALGDEVARRSMLISELHTRIAKEVAELSRQMELQREAAEQANLEALSHRAEVMTLRAEPRQLAVDNGQYDRITELLERERSERVFDTTAARAEIAKGLQTERDSRLREAVELRRQLSSALSSSIRDGAEVAKRLELEKSSRDCRSPAQEIQDKEPERSNLQMCWSRQRPPPDAGEQALAASPSSSGVLGPALTPGRGSLS